MGNFYLKIRFSWSTLIIAEDLFYGHKPFLRKKLKINLVYLQVGKMIIKIVRVAVFFRRARSDRSGYPRFNVGSLDKRE